MASNDRYLRTRGMIANDIYAVIYGKDIRVFREVMQKKHPKAKGCLDNLTLEQLEQLLPDLHNQYEKWASTQEEVTTLS